jgi:hypothetical protein
VVAAYTGKLTGEPEARKRWGMKNWLKRFKREFMRILRLA